MTDAEQCNHWKKIEHSDGDEWCCMRASDHDAEIARKERERVLDKVMGTISNLNLPCNMNPYDTVACIRGEIESLRGEP